MKNPREISDNEIHIYQSYINKPPSETDNFRNILSQDELQKADRYKFDSDRNNYITCRAILRNILSQYTDFSPEDINFSYTDKGKPYLKNNEINFNVAHSNNYAVYALIKEKEVGIDLEFLREIPDALKIASRYFSSSEITDLKKISDAKLDRAFLNCWTRKEAFIKATGDGLSYPLSDFSVSLDSDLPEILLIKKKPNEIKKWSLYDVEVEAGYISSLAVMSQGMKLVYKKL